MKKKTIKLVVALLLTGFVFALTACDHDNNRNQWQAGAANRFKNAKFAPLLQEVLPESAVSLLFADEGGTAASARNLSPDPSWLQRSPDSLLAGQSFARNGEYVIEMFERLGGEDGEIKSRVEQAVALLSAGFIDITNEWVSMSDSIYTTRGFYSDANNTQTVHSEHITRTAPEGTNAYIRRSTGIIHPDGNTELFFDDQDYNEEKYFTSYSHMKGEDFVYYNNTRLGDKEAYSEEYEDYFTYMEFKTNPQGKKIGTYIFVSDRRNFFDGQRVDYDGISYVSFEGDANGMVMYHGSHTYGGTFFESGLTLVQNGISASFTKDNNPDYIKVFMDTPALSGIDIVYYTKHQQYNWFYGQGIDAGGTFYGAGYNNGPPPTGANIMWTELDPRLVLTGTTYELSDTEIMGGIGMRVPLTADPIGQFSSVLEGMGINIINMSFPDFEERYADSDSFIDTLRIGDIDIELNMDNFDAIHTAIAAFFDTQREVFLQN